MTLSCIAHVKRNSNNGVLTRPPAPPIASFMGSTWDRSGSMEDMNGTPGPALYDWVKDACDQARILDQNCYLSVTTFDDKAERKLDNIHWKNVIISLNDARSWTKPRGMTKLYDTAVADIKRLRSKAENYRQNLPYAVRCLNPRIVIAWSLMTDGMDNHSQICNQNSLAEAVCEARDAGCHCYFLAANCDGEQRGIDYGFDQNNSLTFAANRECSDNAFRGISQQLRTATAGSQQTSIPQTLRQSSCPVPSQHTNNTNTVLLTQNTLATNRTFRPRLGRSLRTPAVSHPFTMLTPPHSPTSSQTSAANTLLSMRTPRVNLRQPAQNSSRL